MPGRGKKRLGRPKGSTTKTKPKKRKRGRPYVSRQAAIVDCNEEALGRAQEKSS